MWGADLFSSTRLKSTSLLMKVSASWVNVNASPSEEPPASSLEAVCQFRKVERANRNSLPSISCSGGVALKGREELKFFGIKKWASLKEMSSKLLTIELFLQNVSLQILPCLQSHYIATVICFIVQSAGRNITTSRDVRFTRVQVMLDVSWFGVSLTDTVKKKQQQLRVEIQLAYFLPMFPSSLVFSSSSWQSCTRSFSPGLKSVGRAPERRAARPRQRVRFRRHVSVWTPEPFGLFLSVNFLSDTRPAHSMLNFTAAFSSCFITQLSSRFWSALSWSPGIRALPVVVLLFSHLQYVFVS